VSLYNRDRDRPSSSSDGSNTSTAQSTAFAELISYIKAVLEEGATTPVFQLSELNKLYADRVVQLGGDCSEGHCTRLKNKVLSYFPQLEAYTENRKVLLVANANIGKSLLKACELVNDSEAVLLSRAANLVRKHMLTNESSPFSGSFADNCRENSVPSSLLMLITMIMYGTNIKDKASYLSQPALSLAQLIKYNSCIRRRRQPFSTTRHNEKRETPLPLFLGALVHSRTRSKDLVDKLYRLGLSVSHDRVLSMSADLCNATIGHFEQIGTVCPPTLNIGVFTTAAVDNIDHNPTATSAHGSFHGTGISLFQHPETDNRGKEQTRIYITKSGGRVKRLPDSYTIVPVIAASRNEPPVLEVWGLKQAGCGLISKAIEQEYQWCGHVTTILEDDNEEGTTKELHVSWAAYHSSRAEPAEPLSYSPTATIALRPLFPRCLKVNCDDSSFYECSQEGCTSSQSWTNTCDHLRSAPVQNCEASSVDVAGNIWGGFICDHTGWPSH